MLQTACLLLALLAGGASLAAGQTKRGKRPAPKPKTALASTTTATGLTCIITKRGAGRLPKAGETVVVHYTGTLTDGKKFDSSRDGLNQPFEFRLSAGQVIKGWDEGIARLRVGDQAILIIPPALGYGAKGAGDGLIPSNATLVFFVELVNIKAAER
jgi:peptidylprolyl isomerase